MATMLFWCHNALECGLTVLPGAPCTLANAGAPSALRYLKAWIQRPAWVDCYKTTSLYNSAMMMAAAQTIHKMAGLMHSRSEPFLLSMTICMCVILDGLIVFRYTWPPPYLTAPDAVDGGRDLYVIMARARRLDLGYMHAVGAFTPRFVAIDAGNAEEELGPVVGHGIQCSPRHRMPFASRHEGSNACR